MIENIKPGIYAGISNHDYHTGPGISKSGLDLVHQSPAHLAEARSNTEPKEATRAQMIGTAFHSLLLEPEQFALEYVQPLRREDFPDAVEDREVLAKLVEEQNATNEAHFTGAIRDAEQLVAMIETLNENRAEKLQLGGSKSELVERILNNQPEETYTEEQLNKMKVGDLKEIINQLNVDRPGKLSTNGSVKDLAERLRNEDVHVTLWSEVCAEFEAKNGYPLTFKTSASRHDMAEWLRKCGHKIELWSDVQAGFFARNEGKAILSDEDWQMLHKMRDAVMAHPGAKFLLQHAADVVVDVKTCEDASPEAFARSIANWRYHVQHPFYLDGLRQALEQSGHQAPVNGAAELSAYWTDPKTGVLCRCRPDFWRGQPKYFVFLAVEKSACVVNGVAKGVAVYKLGQDSVELGRHEYVKDLERYARCEKNNQWPGYSSKIEPIDLPAWVFARAEA